MSISLRSNIGARLASLTLLVASFVLVFVACDSGPDLTAEEASGTITGKVIDHTTSEGISGATVTVAVDTTDKFTATTGSDGQFVLHDIPATTGANAGESSSGYLVTVEAPDPYRDARGTVEMRFGSESGGTGGLRAGMTFPLSKANGTVSGKIALNTSNGEVPLNEGPLILEQTVPVQFDASGSETESIQTKTVTTSSADGTFSFDNVLVDRAATLSLDLEGSSQRAFTAVSVPASDPTVEEVTTTLAPPPFKIVDVTPGEGVDADTSQPSFTFTFNRAVADNQFASTELGQQLKIDPQSAKALRTDGDIPVDMSFNESRTELTVTPSEPLQDGFNYEHSAPGFQDSQFTDVYGITLKNPNRGDVDFSVGINNSVPATPLLSFDTENGRVQDDGSLEPGTFDYEDSVVDAPLQIDKIDHSEVQVKEYEVYARSQNDADRSGTGDQFKHVGTVDVDTDSDELGFDDGELEFSEVVRDYPFEGEDGSYGPVEWKVRAVSINNEKSNFSDALVTPDNDSLTLAKGNTLYDDHDGDGDDELKVLFDEPVDPSSIDNNNPGNQFSIDNGGSGDLAVDAVAEINNQKASHLFGAAGQVIIELSGSSGDQTDDVLTVTEAGATDLAGNPADVEGTANEDSDL